MVFNLRNLLGSNKAEALSSDPLGKVGIEIAVEIEGVAPSIPIAIPISMQPEHHMGCL